MSPRCLRRCSGRQVQLSPYSALNMKHLTIVLLELMAPNCLSESGPLITVTVEKRRRLAVSLPAELKEREKGFYQCLHSCNKVKKLGNMYKQDVRMIPYIQTSQALKL